MRLYTTIAALRCYLDLHRPRQILGHSIGFVPTMGALHAGHLSLIERARAENSMVVVSIFVNPLQFGPNEDLAKYPRTLERDQWLCEQAGVDVIFAPNPQSLGITPSVGSSDSFTQVVPPPSMSTVLCGHSRVGHFQGVATIVTKLFNIVQPDHAYFGQKDAQQVAIIRRMVEHLNLPVEIVSCPIVREDSGLALSSRNQYLTSLEKQQAAVLYRSLQKAQQLFKAGTYTSAAIMATVKAELATEPNVQLEYIELVDPNTLMRLEKIEEVGLLALAARVGSTRLIDNIVLRNRQPIIAIDGPAGAGKSTVASQVAQNLGLMYLDTGAMYRAVTWLVLKTGISVHDEPAVAELIATCHINISGQSPNLKVEINGEDVTQVIRSLEVTANVSAIAAQPAVRELLVKQQQQIGQKGGIVAEGRDIGTHVFPDAELKIFLTASVQERARRRQSDIEKQGQGLISLDQLEQDISERDRKDSSRAIAPLRKAPDAVEISTDGLTIAQVIERIVSAYQERVGMPV